MAETRFVVERRRWANRHPGPASGFWHPVPATDVVATFNDRSAAEAECRRLEAGSRIGADPFLLGGPALFYQTSLDSGRLYDWLLDHDAPVPASVPPRHKEWRKWWGEVFRKGTEDQRRAVWEALDKARFYQVSEWPAARAYAVLTLAWKDGVGIGEALPADPEGGHLQEVYRTREAAELARNEVDQRLRDAERDDLATEVDLHATFSVSRAGVELQNATVEEVPFAETVEVPVWGKVRRKAYLLWRPAYDADGQACRNGGDLTEGDVPLALYAKRKEAETERSRRETEARQCMNPFAFWPPHGSLTGLTARTYEELRGAVAALGLEPPAWKRGAKYWPLSYRNSFWPPAWEQWWNETVDGMSDQHRDGVWGLLERLRFFSVTEVPVEG